MSLLHEEYRDERERLLLFECTECGETYLSLGSLHAHVEGHWSLLGSLRWHITGWILSDSNKWWDYTTIKAVESTERVTEDVLP